jgi:glycosyltransferase involved in cell wall biosynthesis
VPPDDRLRLAFLGDPNSVHTRRWLSWFAEHGHEVSLLEGFGAEIAPDIDARIQVERYQAFGRHRAPFISSLHARRELRRLIDRLRPDVLHAHFVRRFGWQGSLAGFHPFVVSPWGSDLLVVPRQAWRTRWWNRRALRSADLVTVTTEHMRAAALRSGARPDRIEMVQHGVDTQRFAPGQPPPELVDRLALGDAAMIFSPRMLRPLYRHETIIEAFAQLAGEPILVMSAAGANAAYLATLREQVQSLGVTERVRIVDSIPHDEMPAYFRAARVVVSVPESDSFPVSLLEAMACAVPVIASDLPPARAVLEPLAPGSVVPVGDAASLADALRRVLAMSADDRRRPGEALRRHVVQVADYEANMARMESLYRRLARRA